MFCQLRIARPVTDLQASLQMYCQGLALEKIAGFDDHDGFSGVMLGRNELPWHLEFTLCQHHPLPPSPTADDLLVLYYPDNLEWQQACQRMEKAGFNRVNAFNPYWDIHGQTFSDRDGYRVVIHNRRWPI